MIHPHLNKKLGTQCFSMYTAINQIRLERQVFAVHKDHFAVFAMLLLNYIFTVARKNALILYIGQCTRLYYLSQIHKSLL